MKSGRDRCITTMEAPGQAEHVDPVAEVIDSHDLAHSIPSADLAEVEEQLIHLNESTFHHSQSAGKGRTSPCSLGP